MEIYEPMKVLGEGSFGKVYLMKHKTTRELVCTKVIKLKNLPKKEQIACRNEVEVLRRMRHPNIVGYHDSFLYKNCLCIIMEYCDAGDLGGRVNKARGRLFPEGKILTWFVQVALGLHYMHSNHTLHRDIKTQNIFILSSGRVVLGDLGISKVMEGTMDFASTCIGTPYYMSPEIFQNKPYNNKSDVWALGCVLYELTTLKHAFDASSINGLAYKIIKGRYPAPDSRYSRQLRGLIKDLLGTNPKARPDIEQVLRKSFVKQRVREFVADVTLESLGAGLGASLASLHRQLEDLGMADLCPASPGSSGDGGHTSTSSSSRRGSVGSSSHRSSGERRGSRDGGIDGGSGGGDGGGGRGRGGNDRSAEEVARHRQKRLLEAEEEKRMAAESALQRLQDQAGHRSSHSGGVGILRGLGGRRGSRSPGSTINNTAVTGGGGSSTGEWREETGGASDYVGRVRTPSTNSPSPQSSPVASGERASSPRAASGAAAVTATADSAAAAAAAAAGEASSGGNSNDGGGTPGKRRNSMLRKLMDLGGRGRSGSISGAPGGGTMESASTPASAAAAGSAAPSVSGTRGESKEREGGGGGRGFVSIITRSASRASITPEDGAAEACAAATAAAAAAAGEKPRFGGILGRRNSRSPGSPHEAAAGSRVTDAPPPPPPPAATPPATPPKPAAAGPAAAAAAVAALAAPAAAATAMQPAAAAPLPTMYRRRDSTSPPGGLMPLQTDATVLAAGAAARQAAATAQLAAGAAIQANRHPSHISSGSGLLPEVQERRGSVSPSSRNGGSGGGGGANRSGRVLSREGSFLLVAGRDGPGTPRHQQQQREGGDGGGGYGGDAMPSGGGGGGTGSGGDGTGAAAATQGAMLSVGLPPRSSMRSSDGLPHLAAQHPPPPQPPMPLQRPPAERRGSVSLSPLRTALAAGGGGSTLADGPLSKSGEFGTTAVAGSAGAVVRGRRPSLASVGSGANLSPAGSPERGLGGSGGVARLSSASPSSARGSRRAGDLGGAGGDNGGGNGVNGSGSPPPRLPSMASQESLGSGFDGEMSELLDAQARAHRSVADDDDIHAREALLREQLRLAEKRCQELRQSLQKNVSSARGPPPPAMPARGGKNGSDSGNGGSGNGGGKEQGKDAVGLGQVKLSVNMGTLRPLSDGDGVGGVGDGDDSPSSGYGTSGLSLEEEEDNFPGSPGDDSGDGDAGGADGGGVLSDDGGDDTQSPYGPSRLGTIEDPPTPVGRMHDRVNYLRRRCIDGLGSERFTTALALLRTLADDAGAVVMYEGRAYGGQDDDEVRRLLEKVIGADKLQYWGLLDQLLLMGA